ncbi:MAG: cyclic nucleotide-binding domain-containing protein [Chromatiales bacterium]|jgi:CRP-like cAMP-binding protein
MNSEVETSIVSAETISKSPLGNELDDSQCELLAESVSAICLEKGAMLLEEGHCDDTLYVVVEGSLEVVKSTGGGDNLTLQVLHAGDMAGIMGFVDGVQHSAGIRALNNCELFSLDRSAMEAMLVTDPEVVYQVMRAIVRAAHRLLSRMNLQHVEMANYINKQHGRY